MISDLISSNRLLISLCKQGCDSKPLRIRCYLVMTDKTAKLPFLVNILITNQGVTLFLSRWVGIKEGHVLVYVGQYRINDIEELGALLKIMQKGDTWEVGIVWSDKFGEHQGYARIKIL